MVARKNFTIVRFHSKVHKTQNYSIYGIFDIFLPLMFFFSDKQFDAIASRCTSAPANYDIDPVCFLLLLIVESFTHCAYLYAMVNVLL